MEFLEGVYNEAEENSEIGKIIPGESEHMSLPQRTSVTVTENITVENETEEAENVNPLAAAIVKKKEDSDQSQQ